MASDLPEEILIEIFSRLPTKSVGKFRCLSKYWCTYLSTTQFVNLHLNKTHQENIILININSLRIIPSLLTTNDMVSKRIDFSTYGNTFWKFFRGSCNGLVMLQNTEHDMFLVNPITLQCLNIPDIDNDSSAYYECEELLGFGHDPSSDDYKVVKLSWNIEEDEDEDEAIAPIDDEPIASIHVYSVKRGSWKRVVVDNSPPVAPPKHWNPFMAFVDGALHWLSTASRRCFIVGFDLEYEVFREIPIPIDFDFSLYWNIELSVLGGCLYIIADNSIVWVMKEYGVVDSWISYSTGVIGSWFITLTPLCFVGDDELFCRGHVNEWYVYNVKDRMVKRVYVGGVSSANASHNVGAFVDSLVSLDNYVPSTHL